jgi:hypothetical protein
MSPPTEPPPMGGPDRRPAGRGGAILALGLALLLAGVFAAYYLYYPSRLGPEQPISFSHRFHVTEKRLSCLFCHEGAARTDRAGVPPLETCMLCHSRIIITHPQIVKLREHYEQGRPIAWARVNDVPEFVYFSHEAHVRKGIDCGRCHGDVAAMDRLAPAPELLMGFCVQCHRDNQASHDCLTCHR